MSIDSGIDKIIIIDFGSQVTKLNRKKNKRIFGTMSESINFE